MLCDHPATSSHSISFPFRKPGRECVYTFVREHDRLSIVITHYDLPVLLSYAILPLLPLCRDHLSRMLPYLERGTGLVGRGGTVLVGFVKCDDRLRITRRDENDKSVMLLQGPEDNIGRC